MGIEYKKNSWMLYLSMIMFAVTLYTYGIALYLTPIFLFIVAIYLLIKRKITIRKLLICILIFFMLILPIILMGIINLFNLSTIHIGKLTIQNFTYTTRIQDMLIFSENIVDTFLNNINYMYNLLLNQTDGLIWNSFPKFGTIYIISLPIIMFEILIIFNDIITKQMEKKYSVFGLVLVFTWLFTGIICGILINKININRINIIWYVLIILNGMGIYEIVKILKFEKIFTIIILGIYFLNFISFINYYHTIGNKEIANSFTWSQGLVDAIEFVESTNEQKIILSENVTITDKQDIFIRYGTKVRQKQKCISKEEFFIKYYMENQTANIDFSTDDTEYIISNIEEKIILTEPIYIITKQEENKILNIDNYQQNIFGKYIVLEKMEE